MWHKCHNSLLQLVGLKYNKANIGAYRWNKMKSSLVKTRRSNGVYFKITRQRIKKSYVITSFLLLSLSETPKTSLKSREAYQTLKITFYIYLRKFKLPIKREADTEILQRSLLL